MDQNKVLKRLEREYQEIAETQVGTECGIRIEKIGDSFKEFKGAIAGPRGTPYEGGTFELKIKIPDKYPFKSPTV